MLNRHMARGTTTSTDTGRRNGTAYARFTSVVRGAMVLLATGLFVSSVEAHDMWITPTPTTPAVGDIVAVGLHLGHVDQAEVFPRQPDHLARFAALHEGTEVALPGQAGSDPAGYFKPTRPGLHALVYESHGSLSELPADRFDGYLVEEGLESIREWRHAHGEADRPGRERYRRSLKSLVWVSNPETAAPPTMHDQAVGIPLELVLESGLAATDAAVSAHLLWHGTPLANTLVDLHRLGSPTGMASIASARTDDQGRVSFAESASGRWMLAAVHMERAENDATSSLDKSDGWEWQSVFTTLTFESR